ncbi:TIGR03118 family protein [Actinacidiphila acididurans]|uniref:TIGR03118 family protein n=1 Tax=Actinacidiphila acididurans TaxID=2784346 RepID=A0ABS2TKB2_9ACTN|nr:TIGR03118 family protein [Actinacidiphila acididurans]MBM9503775.1 TIGR03118 family protein [Actinacidiphila acididurans]
MIRRLLPAAAVAATVTVTAALAVAGPAAAHDADHGLPAAGRTLAGVTRTDLVSDQPGAAQLTDPNLVNAWGLAHGPNTPLWVSNAGTGTSTLYTGGVNGSPAAASPLVVKVPGGPVTGQTFNGTTGFDVPGTTTPAAFLFATVGGAIDAWAGASGPQAAVAATVPGAQYTGLTLANSPFGPLLLAADFHDGRVDVFDSAFHKLDVPGLFSDPRLPRGYAPFNVQVLGDSVYVSYALQDAAKQFDVPGVGHGFVDRFTLYGTPAGRVAARGALNSPWGLAVAPQGFGRFAGDLLVGNFGDGTIHAYDPATGRFLGTVADTSGKVIRIDKLWALTVGDAVAGGPDSIWFSAGPGDETHGLLGLLTAK